MQRRDYLKTGVGLTTVGLAGCLEEGDEQGDTGDDDGTGGDGQMDDGGADGGADDGGQAEDGDITVTFSSAPEPTTNYAAFSTMGGILNEASDELFLDVRPIDRTGANLGTLQREEANLVFLTNYTVQLAKEGIEPFGDVDVEISQVVHASNVSWFPVTHLDISSVDEIAPEHKVSMAPRGSQIREMMEYALHHVLDEGNYESVSSEYSELGSDMSEGRTDVVNLSIINPDYPPAIEAGFNQLLTEEVDITVLEWPEEALDAFREDPLLSVPEIPLGEFDGYGDVPDEYYTVADPGGIVTRPDMDYDTIYTFLEELYEAREAVADGHAMLNHHDPEYWVHESWPDIPYHEAAADFYEEIGVWSDEFSRA